MQRTSHINMKYLIEVTRESWASTAFSVEADSQDEAEEIAVATASDHKYGSGNAQYEITAVQQIKENNNVS